MTIIDRNDESKRAGYAVSGSLKGGEEILPLFSNIINPCVIMLDGFPTISQFSADNPFTIS